MAPSPRLFWIVLTIVLVVLVLGREGLREAGTPQLGHDFEFAQTAVGCPNTDDREAARTRGTCPSSGPCWSLPRSVVVAFLSVPAERHPPSRSVDAFAEWVLPPPDQPPRTAI